MMMMMMMIMMMMKMMMIMMRICEEVSCLILLSHDACHTFLKVANQKLSKAHFKH